MVANQDPNNIQLPHKIYEQTYKLICKSLRETQDSDIAKTSEQLAKEKGFLTILRQLLF
jgi:hypothetical protein